MSDELSLFEDKAIRRVEHDGRWWFVIVDIVAALTGSADAPQYLKKLRQRDAELASLMNPIEGGVQFVPPLLLPVPTTGGEQLMSCWDTQGILRLIQSVPSPKAEPFKRWLATVGYERIQEIGDPELATARTRELYKAKGYSEAWIEKRMRGIAVRDELTGEWSQRGVKAGKDYSILTAEISKATFGMTPTQYREYKGLRKENLRDHMTDLELIFSMLREASTTEITRAKDAQGMVEAKAAAQAGGDVAGNARKELEQKSKKKVITPDNYLDGPQFLKDGSDRS